MTTIAFRNGVLAADTLCTNVNLVRLGYAEKIHRVGDRIMGCTGYQGYMQKLKRWLEDPQGEPPYDDDSTGLVVDASGALTLYEKGLVSTVSDADFKAFGSGMEFAMGAMAMGADAEEAVRVAIRFDTRSGGDVTVLRLPGRLTEAQAERAVKAFRRVVT